MTDINKAIAFATECLGWESACQSCGQVVDMNSNRVDYVFHHRDISDVQARLETFLGKRYYIQVNRGTSTLFKWTAYVGLQDVSVKTAHLNQARADADDLHDAIFDACVLAARMDAGAARKSL